LLLLSAAIRLVLAFDSFCSAPTSANIQSTELSEKVSTWRSTERQRERKHKLHHASETQKSKLEKKFQEQDQRTKIAESKRTLAQQAAKSMLEKSKERSEKWWQDTQVKLVASAHKLEQQQAEQIAARNTQAKGIAGLDSSPFLEGQVVREQAVKKMLDSKTKVKSQWKVYVHARYARRSAQRMLDHARLYEANARDRLRRFDYEAEAIATRKQELQVANPDQVNAIKAQHRQQKATLQKQIQSASNMKHRASRKFSRAQHKLHQAQHKAQRMTNEARRTWNSFHHSEQRSARLKLRIAQQGYSHQSQAKHRQRTWEHRQRAVVAQARQLANRFKADKAAQTVSAYNSCASA
jgi:hypothetical protein